MRAPGLLLLPALVLLAAPVADARPPHPLHPGRHPGHPRNHRVDPACRPDARDLCDDLDRGESVVECLLDQRKDLSDVCRATLEAPRLTRSDRRDCREDTREFCRRVRGARLAACLVLNKRDLDPDCLDAVESAQREQGLLPERAERPPKPARDDPKAKAGKKKAARDEDADDGEAGDAEAGPGDAPER